MPVFAQLDTNNIVINIVTISDDESPSEDVGISFCESFYDGGNFIQTFPDNSKRRRYARLGDYYDKSTDGFYIGNIEQNNIDPVRYCNLSNNTSYCVIYRNASSLFTGLIASTYFDQQYSPSQSAINLKKINTYNSCTGTPYAIIRDPVDRFISSYSLTTGGVPAWLPVDQFISWLVQQDKTKLNPHFMPQVNLIGIPAPSNIVYFDFAKDLTPMAVALGLPTPLPSVNVTDTSKKPTLTADQIATLQSFYADDVALYKQVSAS